MSAPLLGQERIEELAGTSFNSCLLNYYRSGADNMGYHSDNEPLYGRHPTIGERCRPACVKLTVCYHALIGGKSLSLA